MVTNQRFWWEATVIFFVMRFKVLCDEITSSYVRGPQIPRYPLPEPTFPQPPPPTNFICSRLNLNTQIQGVPNRKGFSNCDSRQTSNNHLEPNTVLIWQCMRMAARPHIHSKVQWAQVV